MYRTGTVGGKLPLPSLPIPFFAFLCLFFALFRFALPLSGAPSLLPVPLLAAVAVLCAIACFLRSHTMMHAVAIQFLTLFQIVSFR